MHFNGISFAISKWTYLSTWQRSAIAFSLFTVVDSTSLMMMHSMCTSMTKRYYGLVEELIFILATYGNTPITA